MLRSRDHVGQLEYRFFLLSHRFLFPFNLFLLTPFLSFHSALITLCRLCEGCLQFFYCILYHSHMIFVRHTRQFMYPSFRVLLIYRASFLDYLNTPRMPACRQSSNFELFRKTQSAWNVQAFLNSERLEALIAPQREGHTVSCGSFRERASRFIGCRVLRILPNHRMDSGLP